MKKNYPLLSFFQVLKKSMLKKTLIICGALVLCGTTFADNKVDSLLNIANSINEFN